MQEELKIEILAPDSYERWNQFVDISPQGDVFCYSWWLDAIIGSRFKICAAFEKDDIVAGTPLAFDSGGKINEPSLTRTLGVLYRPQPGVSEHKQISNQRRWLEALLEYIPVEDIVQFCAHHNFTDWLPFRWKGLKQTTRYTYLVDYRDKTAEDLWKGLNSGRRSSIVKAGKSGLRVEDTDDLKLLYDLVKGSYRRQKLNFRFPFEDFENLDNAIKNNGKRLILKAVDANKHPHAAIYVVLNTKSAYNLLSGGDPDYRESGGHTLVLWEALKYFSDKVEYFNFGGSDIRNIEEHVRGFGGIMTPYFHIYNDKLLHSTDIRFHLNEVLFHLSSMVKAIIGRQKIKVKRQK